MNIDSKKGAQVETDEEYPFVGYWVNKDLSDPNSPYWIDIIERAPSYKGIRAVFVYFGMKKPTKKEMETLIKKTPRHQ